MTNQCKNTIILSTQNRENFLALRDQIQKTYVTDLLWESSTLGNHFLRMTFISEWVFPLHRFQRMTLPMIDPTLKIEVFSREESMSYVGHYRYRQGFWQMKPLDWVNVPPEDLTNLGVTATFSRHYNYTEQEMTERLGYAPSTYKELRLYEAKMLALEDLYKDFREGEITAEKKAFILSATIHEPERLPMEATAE